MRKILFICLLAISVIALGACSAGATDKKQDGKQAEESTENKKTSITYSNGSSKEELPLVETPIESGLAKSVHLPDIFELDNKAENDYNKEYFAAEGTGEYQNILIIFEGKEAKPNPDWEEESFRRGAEIPFGDEPTEVKEIDISAHPEFKEKFDVMLETKSDYGVSYKALRIGDEKSYTYTINFRKAEERNNESFALDILKNLEL